MNDKAEATPVKGRRIYPDRLTGLMVLEPMDYAYHPDSATWYGKTPNGHMCNLKAHNVVVHEDETITVSPSIKVNAGPNEVWHGYLTRGVWDPQ